MQLWLRSTVIDKVLQYLARAGLNIYAVRVGRSLALCSNTAQYPGVLQLCKLKSESSEGQYVYFLICLGFGWVYVFSFVLLFVCVCVCVCVFCFCFLSHSTVCLTGY